MSTLKQILTEMQEHLEEGRNTPAFLSDEYFEKIAEEERQEAAEEEYVDQQEAKFLRSAEQAGKDRY
jgi:hypothetical protein